MKVEQPQGIVRDTINELKLTVPSLLRRVVRGDIKYIYRGDPDPSTKEFHPQKFAEVLEYVRANAEVQKTATCWEFICSTPESKVLPVRKAKIRIVGGGLDPDLNILLTHGGYGNINPYLLLDWFVPSFSGINKACIQPFDDEQIMRLAFSSHYDQAVTFALSVGMIEEVIKERNDAKIVYVGASMGGIAGVLQAIHAKNESGLPDKLIIVAGTAVVTDIFRKAPDYSKLVDHQAERASYQAYEGTYPTTLAPVYDTLSKEALLSHLRVVIFKDDNTVINQTAFYKDLPDDQKLIVPGGHATGTFRNLGQIRKYTGNQIRPFIG